MAWCAATLQARLERSGGCSGSRAAKRRREAEEEAALAQAAEDKRSRYELALEKANRAADLARRGTQGAGGSGDEGAIGADDEDEQLQRNLLQAHPSPPICARLLRPSRGRSVMHGVQAVLCLFDLVLTARVSICGGTLPAVGATGGLIRLYRDTMRRAAVARFTHGRRPHADDVRCSPTAARMLTCTGATAVRASPRWTRLGRADKSGE